MYLKIESVNNKYYIGLLKEVKRFYRVRFSCVHPISSFHYSISSQDFFSIKRKAKQPRQNLRRICRTS